MTVGILRGGPSSEHEVSLQTGENVLKNLHPAKYTPRDILIDKEGVWHINGASRKPGQALKGVDVAFNALHGEYGEDGRVQHILEHFSVPYTGSKLFSSILAMNKILTKQRVLEEGMKTPMYAVVRVEGRNREEAILSAFRSVPLPAIIKPVNLGSSVGMTIARDFVSFESGIRKALAVASVALVEEFIKGKEASCGVIEGFRGKDIYSLLPIEIRPPSDKDFFDYEAKYSGKSQEICPGNFSPEEMTELQRLAVLAHRALGLRHYSRSDFIVTPKRGIYFLEANNAAAVGLTPESLMPKALRAVGSDLPEFLDHVITLALAP
ncbi:MAG: hypothetical protein A3C06_04145 [Candidatus Taylorbacteria bacterium RIFCSPHIGHO2_02_FULL_46_13]|uniref:D-alanine--D-alanine ligase n=1 Tax=Candidatus Taylorbacteria bacterium RIFCSPHIGHO2_02_FULL_46_13 TaxID=1802312 RepID=A0A1G2MU09_9BACT|nr:MAG: hypothetical protein A3C06_04145 [Candidatus Taylorbacteria bacterium RIFCSPHIGHO2_02_FULL_46_13]